MDTFWVVPGRFLAGVHPVGYDLPGARARLTTLLHSGLLSFIDLTEPIEKTNTTLRPPVYDAMLASLSAELGLNVLYQRFPIADLGTPTPAQMILILDAIDASLAFRRIYLHDWSLGGRAGTVIGCFLARHGLVHGRRAMERFYELRRRSSPDATMPLLTTDQQNMVVNWRMGE